MRKDVSIYLASLAFMLLTACAQVPMANDSLDHEAKKFTPSSGKGALYIHRHEGFGRAYAHPVLINGLSLGQLAPSTYVLLNLNPGLYSIESNSLENTSQIEVTVTAGKNTFVWLETKLGMVIGPRGPLHLSDEKAGRQAVMDSQLIAASAAVTRIIPLGTTPSKQSSEEVAAVRLREIKKLRDDGVLSEEEYQSKRKQLLDQL